MEYTADNITTEAMAPFSCRFARRKCQHEQLFQTSYLRTNRTNHTKIMRCFPHCCPGHRKRSYCGSPVFFQLDQSTIQRSGASSSVLASDQLVVYARFRPTTTAPLVVGDCVDLTTIEEGLQHKDPSKGEWIESELSHCSVDPSDGTVSWVFEVNASGRWYYPWSGAATIALRATDHVFEVLAFRRHSHNSKTLELLATTASSTFRLMSFRRGTGAASAAATTTTAAEASEDALSISSDSPRVSAAVAPPQKKKTKKQPQSSRKPSPPRLPTTSTVKRLRTTSSSLSPPMAVHNSSSATKTTMISPMSERSGSVVHPVVFPRVTATASVPSVCYGSGMATGPLPSFSTLASSSPSLRSHGRSRNTSQQEWEREREREREREFVPTNTLGTLLQWLDELPSTSAGSRRLRDWEHVVMDACAAHRSGSSSTHNNNIRAGLVPHLSALYVSSSRPPPFSPAMNGSTTGSSPLDLIDACVRLFLHLFLDVDANGLANHAKDNYYPWPRVGATTERGLLAASCDSWCHELETRAMRFVHSQTNVAWSDLMATVATLRSQQQRQQQQHQLSRSSDDFSSRAFVAQTRERYVQAQRAKKRPRGSAEESAAGSVSPFDGDARVWVCRMEDVSIEMDNATSPQHTLSMLSVLQFWKHLSCLRVNYSSPSMGSGRLAPQLSLASVFNKFATEDECFTRMTLDGQYRWFSCLPNGDATTGRTLMGFIVGDYVGRATGAGTVHVTTFLWPATTSGTSSGDDATEALAYAWHWTIDATSLLSTNATVMSVVVESARVRSSHSHTTAGLGFETLAIHDKLRCIGRWDHVSQAQLVYRAQ